MAQRERRTKEAAGSKDPAALPGASAGDGQAGTSTEQRSSLRTSTRARAVLTAASPERRLL